MYSNNNPNSECGQFGSTNSSSFQTSSPQYQAYQTTDNIGYFGSYYDPYSQYGYNTAYNNGYFYQAYQPSAYSQVPTSTYQQSTIQDPMPSSVQQQPQDSSAQYTSDVAQPTKHDSTPEKPIMNDSGVDFISPTILQTSSSSSSNVTPSSSVYTPPVTSNEEESDNDESIEEEEDENKENEESSKQGKSKSGKKTSSDSNLPSKPPKPYLEIIANAVLSSPVKMMQLHEIYAYMESKYSYFLMNVNKSWRNSVRHNLSLNECFIKAARGTNGKGNYWRIHPLCEREFIRGNFRRKTFKQLIRAGGHQQRQHQQQQMSLPYPASFGSLPLNYSVGMFPPPPPTISANMFAVENKQLQNNSVHYRPY